MRWIQFASWLVMLAAGVLLVSTVGTGWRWPLFLWGLGIGVAGLAVVGLAFAVAFRRGTIAAGKQRQMAERRLVLYTGSWVTIGAMCGTISAGLDLPEIDWALAVSTLASLGLGASAAIVVLRRNRSRRA